MSRFTKQEIFGLRRELYSDPEEKTPAQTLLAKVLDNAGWFVRSYSNTFFMGQFLPVNTVWFLIAKWMHNEVAQTSDRKAILDMTIGDFLSLYAKTDPGLIVFDEED